MNARSIRAHSSPAARDSAIGLCVRAILLGGAAAAVLLLIGSAVCFMQADPTALIRPTALCALYLSAAICGFYLGRASGQALFYGAAAGGAYCLLLTVLSLIPASEAEGYPLGASVLLHAAVIAAALAGAWLGRRRPSRNTHTRKKRRR